MNVYIYECVHTYIYFYTCIYIYIHIYVRIYMSRRIYVIDKRAKKGARHHFSTACVCKYM